MIFRKMTVLTVLMALLSFAVSPTAAHGTHDSTDELRFEQNLEAQLPLDAEFMTSSGQQIALGDLLRDQPAILIFSYYECVTLCSVALPELASTLDKMSAPRLAEDFAVISISIDATETPEIARRAKAETVPDDLRDAADRWYFLTGDQQNIDRVADAAGFHYSYIAETDEYAHPTGFVVLTAQGIIARYIYGVAYAPEDVRFAIMDSANGTIGTLIDQLQLLCYRYDPVSGRYTPIIMDIVRMGGLLTTAGLGGWIAGMLIAGSRNKRRL